MEEKSFLGGQDPFVLIDMVRRLHEEVGNQLSYQQITADIMELSGAQYGAMNLFEPGSGKFRTVALVGDEATLEKAQELLGFRLEGFLWKEDPEKEGRTSLQCTTTFNELVDLAGEVIAPEVIEIIQNQFDLGGICVLKIQKDHQCLGDFTLFMRKGVAFPDIQILEIYGEQVALVLEKHRMEKELQEKNTKMENILKGTNAGTWEWNIQTGEAYYDQRYAAIVGYTLEELAPIDIRTWNNLGHPEDLIRSDEEVAKVLAGEQEFYAIQCRMRHKEGHWVWVMDRGKVTAWSEDGQPLIMTGTHIDITESKNLEDSIREREENYRILLETSFDIIYRVDLKGHFIYVSQAWNTLLGQSVEGVLGKSFQPFVHPEDLSKVKDFFEDIRRSKNRQGISNYRLRHSDGSWRWFETNATPLWEGNGELIGYSGNARDITDLKKVTDSLRRQVDEMDRFFSVSLDVLVIAKTDGSMVKINKAWENTLGHPLDNSLGHSVLEFIHPGDIDSTKKILEKLEAGHPIQSFINRLRCSDGSYRFLEWKAHPYEGLMYASARDVSDKLKLQESLLLEKEVFKTTLLSVGDGIISSDHSGVITFLNDNAEKITGWERDQALGMPLSRVFPLIRESTGEVFGDLRKLVLEEEKKVDLVDISLLKKDGSLIPIENSAAPIIDINGEMSGVVIVFRDVTDKKERLKEAEYLSFHDYLTGLYNLRYMEDAMARLDTRRNLPFSIIAVDVNGLKLTNDAFGHEAGDRLLKKAAEILKSVCRAEDIVCRIGGDEFMVLLPGISFAQAKEVKKRVLSREENVLVGNSEVSMAMGIGTKEKASDSMEDIRKQADSAMYKEKLTTSKAMKKRVIERILQNIQESYGREHLHLEKVAEYASSIGREIGLNPSEISRLNLAARLHDIGKIILGPEILNKKGSIDEIEMDMVRRHPDVGYQILKAVDDYAGIAEIILFHHERMDGNGYPSGLKGEEIPLLARILAVADTYEAMTAERSYKEPKSKEEAMKEIKDLAGSQYDKEVVEALECVMKERIEK